jgi:hypothetical protein
VSRDTQGTRRSHQHVVYRAVTVSGRSFQIVRLRWWFVTPCDGPYNPIVQARWFGLIRVRSPLLAESLLFSIPVGTEMVHFPTLSSPRLWIRRGILRDEPEGVSSFGDRRVKARLQLTGAYRSLPRPSSTPGAKAFTVHP